MKNGKIIKSVKHSLVSACLLLSQSAWAHNPADRPVVWQPSVQNGPDVNRAGYGYLNTSSEVEAETFFHDLCPQRGGGTITGECAKQKDLVAAGLGNSLAWPAIESSFIMLSQEKVYEHLAMQAAAMGKPIPALPSCLAGSVKARATRTFVDANKNKSEATLATEISTLGGAILGKTSANPATDQATMDGLIKMRSVKNSFSPNKLAQAFMLDKNLKEMQTIRCASATRKDQLACINLRGTRERVRTAFPLIFSSGVLGESMFGDDDLNFLGNQDACGRNARQRFENSLYETMGSFRSPANILPLSNSCSRFLSTTLSTGSTDAERVTVTGSAGCQALENLTQRKMICRGAGLANAGLTTKNGYSSLVNPRASSPGLWDSSVNAMNFAVGTAGAVAPNPALTADQTARLLTAGTHFNSAIGDMQNDYNRKVTQKLNSICTPEGSTLGRIMAGNPLAVQQAVLDIPDPKAKQAVKLMMCQRPTTDQPYLERFQRNNQSFSCKGVTTNPDGSTTVQRESWGWPYVGNVLYNIATEPSGAKVINMPIEFDPQCDAYLTGLPASTGTGAAIGSNLPAADRTRLMNLSDSNGNGLVDGDEFNYFQLTGMSCDNQKAFAVAKATGANSWVSSSNSRWTSQSQAIKPVMKPAVRINIQHCCATGCPITCPAGAKKISIAPCYNADTRSSSCQNSTGNREAEENYSFAQSNSTTWHEMGHAMGLQDEYRDPEYSAHALGETGETTPGACGSTMGSQTNSARGNCEQLHRRHYMEILRPEKLGCATGSGPADRD